MQKGVGAANNNTSLLHKVIACVLSLLLMMSYTNIAYALDSSDEASAAAFTTEESTSASTEQDFVSEETSNTEETEETTASDTEQIEDATISDTEQAEEASAFDSDEQADSNIVENEVSLDASSILSALSSGTFLLSDSHFTVETSDGEYTFSDQTITISKDGTYTITGDGDDESAHSGYKIVINGNLNVYLTINNVRISNSTTTPFYIDGTSTVTLILKGDNVFTSTYLYSPGIQYGDATTASLTITSDSEENTLTATGGYDAAGIGGQRTQAGNNIYITGGYITASSSTTSNDVAGGAGIGGGYGSGGTANNIVISGGTVIANGGGSTSTGGYGGAGIGSGYGSSATNITISGGTVIATGGTKAAGIGGGYGGKATGITISDAVVVATGGTDACGIGGGYRSTASDITIKNSIVAASGNKALGNSISNFSMEYDNGYWYSTSVTSGVYNYGTTTLSSSDYGSSYLKIYPSCSYSTADVVINNNISVNSYISIDSKYSIGGYASNDQSIASVSGTTITGVSVGTTAVHTVVYDFSGEEIGMAGVDVAVLKSDNTNAPSAPTVNSYSANSITLNAITSEYTSTYGNIEYGYIKTGDIGSDSITWQSSIEFTGLDAETSYTFYARYKGNDTYNASSASSVTIYTSYATPNTGVGYTIDYTNEKVTAADGYEVRLNDSSEWTTGSIDITPGSTIYVRQSAYTEAPYSGPAASEARENTLASRPSAPSISIETTTATTITVSEPSDTDTYGAAQYSIDGNTWQTSNVFENLSPNTQYTVYVRYAGGNDYSCFASEAASITATTLKLTPTAENFEFTAPSNLAYDGQQKEATVSAATGVTGMGTITVYYSSVDEENWSKTAPTDPGTYKVRISVAEGDSYYGTTADEYLQGDSWSFTIEKGSSSIAIDETAIQAIKAMLSKTYDGTSVDITAISKENLSDYITGSTGDISYRWEVKKDEGDWEVIEGAPTDAGEYRVIITIEADDNYEDASSNAIEFTISQASNEWTAYPSITGWTVGGTASTPAGSAKWGEVKFVYSNSSTSDDWDETQPATTGTWYMKAYVEETANWAGLSVIVGPFTITANNSGTGSGTGSGSDTGSGGTTSGGSDPAGEDESGSGAGDASGGDTTDGDCSGVDDDSGSNDGDDPSDDAEEGSGDEGADPDDPNTGETDEEGDDLTIPGDGDGDEDTDSDDPDTGEADEEGEDATTPGGGDATDDDNDPSDGTEEGADGENTDSDDSVTSETDSDEATTTSEEDAADKAGGDTLPQTGDSTGALLLLTAVVAFATAAISVLALRKPSVRGEHVLRR